jgi:hypothetical protein
LVQESSPQRGVLPRGILEIWPWLIAAAIAVFAVEWFVYLRGR